MTRRFSAFRFPGDLKQAQPSFSASATPIEGGQPADAGLGAALEGLSIGGEVAAAAPGGGDGGSGAQAAPEAAAGGGEAKAEAEAQGAVAERGAAEKGDSDDAKG